MPDRAPAAGGGPADPIQPTATSVSAPSAAPAVIPAPAHLESLLDQCLIQDRHWLRSRRGDAARAPDSDRARQWQQRLRRSQQRFGARKAALPHPRFEGHLPVEDAREQIARTIAAHPVTIICGETG